MQYNKDANKRTCSLPTHCLPTRPGHISDTQPVIPMERKGTSEQRVHAATHPHTAVLSLQARSQVGFSFSPSFYFLEKFTLKSTSLSDIHICFIIIEVQRLLTEVTVYDTEERALSWDPLRQASRVILDELLHPSEPRFFHHVKWR